MFFEALKYYTGNYGHYGKLSITTTHCYPFSFLSCDAEVVAVVIVLLPWRRGQAGKYGQIQIKMF